jgi:hypothetical protein
MLDQRVSCIECGYSDSLGAILRWIVKTTRNDPDTSNSERNST